MPTVSSTDARNRLADLLNRAASDRERVVLTRRGKPVAALVSVEELQLLERLIEAMEDRLDLEEAERVLDDPDAEHVPWEEVAREL